MSTPPPPVDSPSLVLSTDPRITVTDWQDVAWLPEAATATVQRARVRGQVVEFVASFTVSTGLTNRASAIPSGMRVPQWLAALTWPVNDGGSLMVNSSGTTYLLGVSGTATRRVFVSWPVT